MIHVPDLELAGPEVCEKEDEETGEPVPPTIDGDFTLTTQSSGGEIWFE